MEGDDILVIRVWREPGRASSIRARVLAVGESLDQIEVVTVANSVAEVVDAVVDWLDRPTACR